MSMYNMLFGRNPVAPLLLAMLGLRQDDVGRFRDCYVAEGMICVYTRNGGGNRSCWHADSVYYGDPSCKHHVIEREVDEVVWEGVKSARRTGRQVKKKFYVCEEPDSESCRCVGCFMTYHVHKLEHYHHDRDDDFDSTYATIFFTFPAKFRAELEAMDSGKPWDPDGAWQSSLEALGKGELPEVEERMRPVVERLAEFVKPPAAGEQG